MKLEIAENDSSYTKMYVLIPRTQLHLVCEPRYEVKRVSANILAAILETINSMKLIVAENYFSYSKMYVLIPRTQLHFVCEPRYEVKRVLATILAAILKNIDRMKVKVAENDSSYLQMYVLIPKTQLHLLCEPRYEVKRVLAAILAAILNFDRKRFL